MSYDSGEQTMYRQWVQLGLIVFFVSRNSIGSAVNVDDFSVGPLDLYALQGQPAASINQTGLDTSHVVGGKRFVTLQAIRRSPTATGGVHVAVDPSQSEFAYDADPGMTAANFSIQYGKLTDPLHADLAYDGANSLVLDFGFADFEPGLGYFDLVVDTEPGGRYLYFPVTNSPYPFSFVLPFKAFGLGSNFSDVVSIELGTSNGNLPGDFALTGIRTAFFPDGDYNFDGTVNESDFLVWRSHFGQSGPYNFYPVDPADGNRDAIVDAADYTIWRDNLGATAAESFSLPQVPEPRSGVLGVAGLATCLLTIRRANPKI